MSDQSTTTKLGFCDGENANEVTALADFMRERAANEFESAVAIEIGVIGTDHRAAEPSCKASHGNYGGDEMFPCEEWGRALALGIAWLKSRVLEHETPTSTASIPKRVGD